MAVVIQAGDGTCIFDFADLVLRHAIGQIAVHAAGAEIRGMHACTRDSLVHVVQIFALAEAINQDVHRAAIKTMRTQPQQVVQHAGDFSKHHAYVLGAYGHFQSHEFLNRQTIGVLIAHHGHVVQPVHVGQGLDEGFALGQFFGSAVQQPDMRVSALHHFAV